MRANKILVERPAEQNEYFFKEGCYILELLNQRADPENSIARARVLAGKQTRWHKLLNTTERYVILEGDAVAEIGDKKEPLQTGDVVVIPAGVRQRILNTGTKDLLFLAICTPRFTPDNYVDLEHD